MTPMDSYFTSDFGKKKKKGRLYRIGIPPDQRPEIPQDYGPKISPDDWRAMSDTEKMTALTAAGEQ